METADGLWRKRFRISNQQQLSSGPPHHRKLGFWDLDLTLVAGALDYDYGFRIREAGLTSILTNRARIVHKEHQSIEDFSGYVERAASEMHTVLTQKYGPGWERIKRMRKVVPVILTCDHLRPHSSPRASSTLSAL